LTRQVPVEFAERQTHELNCRECHGKFDGFPSFDILGGKLRPEWSRAFIDGEIKWKPRPWLEARMPAFALPQRAEGIAQGLAMSHGYPPQTPAEPAIDAEAAKVGQKLISMVGGFSCVSCHAVGEFGATQVFDSAGINFARTGSRLMKPYVERWVRNPQSVDPTTKMPVYFDETGKSPLGDVYGGDGAKQIDAIWEYIRLGDKMPPPPTP
jgi:mono/diheme cytochrome c family protein